ncbi:chromosomal replication initiator protein DnaA [Candidatus Saccharibacteria bacterium]|nr:chromosomal replication initiator protein DnaA [Candidatus Saccharibacteria bacterium]
MNEASVWQSVLGEIELSVTRASYITWFKNSELIEINGDKAVVGVSNIFAREQMQAKFNRQILDILQKVRPEVTGIEYVISSAVPKRQPQPAGAATTQATTSTSQRDTNVRETSGPSRVAPQITRPESRPRPTSSNGGLNERYTFETFIVGGSNELAFAASQAAAKNPGTKCNPLFIYGGVGLGKTHLIQAVGNEIRRNDPDARILYTSCETFVNEFLDSIRFKKQGFAERYRNVDVLIIDDIQFIAGKQATQEGFFHTFNALHQANKQIIISSDQPPKSIPTLEERLRSRFEWGMAIDMQLPDFETRCAILQTKASQHDITLDRETVEYIAGNVQTNIRELEGALNKLLTYCEMSGTTPDAQTAAGLISDVRASRPRHLTAKQIVEKTAKHFQLEPAEIMSPKRDKHIVGPRQIAMYLLRSELHLSFPRIASELGRKDHTTAIHSVEKIEKSIKLDQVTRQQVANIREVLYG